MVGTCSDVCNTLAPLAVVDATGLVRLGGMLDMPDDGVGTEHESAR